MPELGSLLQKRVSSSVPCGGEGVCVTEKVPEAAVLTSGVRERSCRSTKQCSSHCTSPRPSSRLMLCVLCHVRARQRATASTDMCGKQHVTYLM